MDSGLGAAHGEGDAVVLVVGHEPVQSGSLSAGGPAAEGGERASEVALNDF